MNAHAPNPSDFCHNGRVALALAEADLFVFPTFNNPNHPNHKKPLVQWLDLSTNDPEQIREWWLEKYRNAMPAIDLSKSNLIVIDGDLHHEGQDGPASIEMLLGKKLADIGAPVVVTPSGGVHVYFCQPPMPDGGTMALGNSKGSLPYGIDIRGHGGYVIAPMAATGDKRGYRRLPGTAELAEALHSGGIPYLPDVIVEAIQAGRQDKRVVEDMDAPQPRTFTKSGNREGAWGQAALANELRRVADAPKGARNDTLAAKAFYLGTIAARGWISSQAAISGLTAAVSGWTDPKKTLGTLNRCFKAGLGFPHEDLSDNRDDHAIELGERVVAMLLEEEGAEDDVIDEENSETSSDGHEQKKADPLHGFTFDGDNTDMRPPPMLVKKLLPMDGVCFLGGQSGAGKTFVAIDLAVSVASGEPFFGHKITERVGVAILAAEGGGTIESRIAVSRNKKAAGEILPVAWLGAVPNLADAKEVKSMVHRLRSVDAKFREIHGVRLGLIVVDTLAAAYALADENDNAEAAKAVRMMNILSVATKAVVMIIHHYGKSAETGLRGASAWRAGSDTVLSVLADRDQITGRCSNRRIALTKSRIGEEGWMAHFDLRFVEMGVDDDGEPYGSCFVQPGEASSPADDQSTIPKSRLTGDAAAYLRALGVVLSAKGEKVRPFGSEGPAVHAAPREDVRQEFYRSRPVDGEDEKKIAEARRKGFKRGEDTARDRGLISSYEVDGVHWVWQVLEPPA